MSATIELKPYYDLGTDLMGFSDSAGKRLIAPQFEVACKFEDNRAAVRVGGRWGFVDTSGKLAVAPVYEAVGAFQHGLAEVISGGRAGVIDLVGRVVVQPQFARAHPLSSTMIAATVGPSSLWFRTGPGAYATSGFTPPYPPIPAGITAPFGLLSINGNWVHQPTLYTGELGAPRFGRSAIWALAGLIEGPRKYGLLNFDGTWTVEPRYSHVAVFSEQYSRVQEGIDRDAKCGVVDNCGRTVLPMGQFDRVSWHRDGLFQVIHNGKVGWIDEGGRLAVGGRWYDEYVLSDPGDAFAEVKFDGAQHFIDRDGRIVPDPVPAPFLVKTFYTGLKLFWVGRKRRCQFIDAQGEMRPPIEFDSAHHHTDGPVPVDIIRKGRSYVFPDGTLLKNGRFFEHCGYFEDGLATAKLNGKWGIIDETGEFVVANVYDALSSFRHKFSYVDAALGRKREVQGFFSATSEGRSFVIDRHGNECSAPERKIIRLDRIPCGASCVFFQDNELWGIAHEDGRTVLEPRYLALGRFLDGVAWVPIEEDRKWYPMEPSGRIRRAAAEASEGFNPLPNARIFPRVPHHRAFDDIVLWNRDWLEALAGLRSDEPLFDGAIAYDLP